jgi:AraC-like DNA-binding protein
VGFKDPAHFSRMFKTTYGSSPRAFRLEMAANRSA